MHSWTLFEDLFIMGSTKAESIFKDQNVFGAFEF